ncbi:hypothetical protein AAG906_005194 [Vitis piasezkii]
MDKSLGHGIAGDGTNPSCEVGALDKTKVEEDDGSVTKMKEWLEEMELEVEEDVGVVQNTQLEQETETYEGYLPLEMNDVGNNNVAWRQARTKKFVFKRKRST